MRHFATAEFWTRLEQLPVEIQTRARKNFELLKKDAGHPSLRFKRIRDVFSVRIGLRYRALGVEVPEGILWFWIGTHSEYDKLIR